MAASQPTSQILECASCGARLPIRVEHVGKKCRCERCGHVFIVESKSARQSSPIPLNVADDEYEPWAVNTAPLPSELIAKQPKLFPVYCRVCDTLMYAENKQIGSQLTCPDCGVKTVVKRPPPKPPSRARPLVEGYELDETSAPGPGPKITPAIIARLAKESESDLKAKGNEQPTQKLRVDSRSSRPQLPRVPLVQGVLSMLFSEAIVVRWIVLSVSLTFVIWLLSFALLPISSQYQVVALGGIVFGALWAMGAAAICMAILTDSSDGNNRLFNPPTLIFYEWFGDLMYVAIATAMAAGPCGAIAIPLAKWLPFDLGPWFPSGAAAIGWLLFFPIVLLSMLEQGSASAILSPKLVDSLWRQPIAWLLFYIETVLLVTGGAAALIAGVTVSSRLVLIAAPVVVGMALVYFRLLGRLAWWLAEREASSELRGAS